MNHKIQATLLDKDKTIKDKTIVEYALKETNAPVGISKYEVVSTLPENLRGQLPEAKQIQKLLEAIEQ